MDFCTSQRTNTGSIYFCFLTVLGSSLTVMTNSNAGVYVASVSGSVLFPCNSKKPEMRNWKIGNITITADRFFLDYEFHDSLTLFPNYSLLINPISLDHGGIYRCMQGGNIVEEFTLEVEVPPELMLTVNRINNITEIIVEENTFVNVTCYAFGARPAVSLTWTNHSGVGLLLNDVVMKVHQNGEIQRNKTFDSQSTLNVLLDKKNGTITCKSTSESGLGNREITLEYKTFVLPRLNIEVNGVNTTAEVFVPANAQSLFICYSYGSRPESNLFWLSNGSLPNAFQVGNQTIHRSIRADLGFDAVLSTTFTVPDISGSIACVSELTNGVHARSRKDVIFHTYVVPRMDVTVNGIRRQNMSRILVESGQEMVVICQADGAKPAVDLVIHLNQTALQTNSTAVLNSDNSTFTITTVLNLQTYGNSGSIACETRDLPSNDVYIMVYYYVKDNSMNQEGTHYFQLIIILLASLAAVIATSAFILKNLKKYLDSRSSYSVTLFSGASEGDGHGPPKFDLPRVPESPEISDYCSGSEDVYESYFELKEKSTKHKIFSGKDMCLILTMNSGHLRSRWMGTIGLTNSEKKCVVFTTASDISTRHGCIRWDGYVKRMLDMPHTESIVKLEGVCVNEGTLYLVHEHLTCESLEILINSKRRPSSVVNVHEPLSTRKVTSCVMDILEGMEVLHSFGFLHPGLSLKKVLVTSAGQCKLYDFFLSEDATNKATNLMTKKPCTINDLPPETLSRNEYTQASDVWCVAVIIWSLMTKDPIPVVLENLNEKNVTKVLTKWPANYIELKNDTFFKCWEYECSLRPSMHKLRSTLTEIRSETYPSASSQDLKESFTDLYIPMTDIKTTRTHSAEMDIDF